MDIKCLFVLGVKEFEIYWGGEHNCGKVITLSLLPSSVKGSLMQIRVSDFGILVCTSAVVGSFWVSFSHSRSVMVFEWHPGN